MKRCLTSLIIREMQVKTTKDTNSYQLGWLLSKTNNGKKKEEKDKKKETIKCTKDVEKLELLYTTSGSVK